MKKESKDTIEEHSCKNATSWWIVLSLEWPTQAISPERTKGIWYILLICLVNEEKERKYIAAEGEINAVVFCVQYCEIVLLKNNWKK